MKNFIGMVMGLVLFLFFANVAQSDSALDETRSSLDYTGIVAADIDGDNNDEIVGDFGALGVWIYETSTGVWTQITVNNPEWIIVGNWNGDGDFVLTWKINGSDDYHITLIDNNGYQLIQNPWFDNTGLHVWDGAWHKFELYIDVGNAGSPQGDGEYTFWIDDQQLYHSENITFNSASISTNPIDYLTGWPSNLSGTPSGTARTWLDELEIWTGGIPNIPNDPPPAPVYNLKIDP